MRRRGERRDNRSDASTSARRVRHKSIFRDLFEVQADKGGGLVIVGCRELENFEGVVCILNCGLDHRQGPLLLLRSKSHIST